MKVSRLSVILIFAAVFLFACQNATNAGSDKAGKPEPAAVAENAITGDLQKGKALFGSKCIFCHDTESTDTIVGPGLKGILKGEKLPASGKPATVENVINQLKTPFKKMPSFSYLKDEEVEDIVSYLNSL
jgi:mono/diheme cytochrome c family protein